MAPRRLGKRGRRIGGAITSRPSGSARPGLASGGATPADDSDGDGVAWIANILCRHGVSAEGTTGVRPVADPGRS